MLQWASSLKWSTANLPVTCVELAIDLKIFHRIYVLRPTSNIRERASTLRTLLNKLHAPGLIGYDRRPVFTYPRYTMHARTRHRTCQNYELRLGNDIPDNKLVEASAADAVR